MFSLLRVGDRTLPHLTSRFLNNVCSISLLAAQLRRGSPQRVTVIRESGDRTGVCNALQLAKLALLWLPQPVQHRECIKCVQHLTEQRACTASLWCT